jgi:squalene synthase HpnC
MPSIRTSEAGGIGIDPAAILAKRRGENFAVASRFLPRSRRADLLAVYGFARLVDDAGDEGTGAPVDRLRALDELATGVDAIFAGGSVVSRSMHPLVRALGPVITAHAIPPEPFHALIQANRLDQSVTRYATFADLAGYCELSANPVGRLVLFVFDASTPDRRRLSDLVCTGLQVVEHLQDVAEDLGRGRVYLPQEDLRTFGVTEADLAAPASTPSVRRLMRFEVARATSLLREGAALPATLPPMARLAVAGYVSGGLAALQAIERGGYDVLGARPRPSRVRRAAALVRALVRPAMTPLEVGP